MHTTNFTPIWVENPYTSQQINVEPLLRFNEQMLHPIVQDHPFSRTVVVLSNALLYMGQCPIKGSSSERVMQEIQGEVMALISAFGKMKASSNLETV